MSYQTEGLLAQLRQARQAAGISQRALSTRTGLTQSHISKIESGAVEPGLDGLVTLARALDLEIVFVPKHLLPAVQGILHAGSQLEIRDDERANPGNMPRAAYGEEDDDA
jgi:transcriptional regulator with XRE-family HTH domain